MSLSLSTAQSIWASAVKESAALPASDLREALDVILMESKEHIDSPQLACTLFGGVAGGGPLSVLLWHIGLGQVEMTNANAMVEVLLEKSADPNKLEYGYRPINLLVTGLHSNRTLPRGPPDIGNIAHLLVKFGLNHTQPGYFPVEKIEDMLRASMVKEEIIHILMQGPQAVELDESTQAIAKHSPRRTL